MPFKQSPERDWAVYMRQAIDLAKIAEENGDVPVGALVLNVDGKVIATAYNEREKTQDPTAHAEVLALRRAAEALGSWRLKGCTLVVTLEPCIMCAGSCSMSRLDRVVYACKDQRAGGMGSQYNVHEDKHLNHEIICVSGVLEQECRELIQNFFRRKRT